MLADDFQRHILAILVYVLIIVFLAFILDLLRKLCCRRPNENVNPENIFPTHNVSSQLGRSSYILPQTSIVEIPYCSSQQCDYRPSYLGVPPTYTDASGLPTYDEAMKMSNPTNSMRTNQHSSS